MYYVYQLQLFTDDHYRAMLRAVAGSDYINASFIDVRLVAIASCNGCNINYCHKCSYKTGICRATGSVEHTLLHRLQWRILLMTFGR